MLSSVLRGPRAVQVNIEIMRAVESHDQAIGEVVSAIRRMMDAPPDPQRRRIGFT